MSFSQTKKRLAQLFSAVTDNGWWWKINWMPGEERGHEIPGGVLYRLLISTSWILKNTSGLRLLEAVGTQCDCLAHFPALGDWIVFLSISSILLWLAAEVNPVSLWLGLVLECMVYLGAIFIVRLLLDSGIKETWEDVEKLETLSTIGRNAKCYGKQHDSSSKEWK